MKYIKYDTNTYDFRRLVEEYLGFPELEKIHEKERFSEVLTADTDQSQPLHRKFYDRMDADSRFLELYRKFIKEVIHPQFNEEILYQKSPTFRVHEPENVGVFEFHKDSDYNHSTHAINCFLPFTKAFDTNAIWVESECGKEDFSPMEVAYGETVMWDGANLKHGSQMNETGQTRVSMDFRILPLKHYDPAHAQASLHKHLEFIIGSYYEKL